MAQKSHNAVCDRGGRLDIAVVGPRKYQHISDKEGDEGGEAEPYDARAEYQQQGMNELGGGADRNRADTLHALAQEDISQGAEKHHDEKGEIRLEVQIRKCFHEFSETGWGDQGNARRTEPRPRPAAAEDGSDRQ